MPVFADRVKVATATTGTGTLTLGAALGGFQSFASGGVSNGAAVTYVIEDGANVEIGTGPYATAGPTLTRTTVHRSIIAGTPGTTKLTLSGDAVVYVTARADDITDASLLASGTVPVARLPLAALPFKSGTVTGGTSIDLATGNSFNVSLTSDRTMSFANVPSEGIWHVTVTATGTWLLGWGTTTEMGGATALDPPDSGNARSYTFWTYDGTTIYGGASL